MPKKPGRALRFCLTATVLIGPFPLPAEAQNSGQFQEKAPDRLERNRPAQSEISRGNPRLYSIPLAAGEYIHIVVEQRGVDLSVGILDANNKSIVEIDNEANRAGAEELIFVAGLAGTYFVQLRVSDQEISAGQYQIRIKEQRSTTIPDLLAFGKMLKKQGEKLARSGDRIASISRMQLALSILERADGVEGLETADALGTLGALYFSTNEFDRAEEYFQRSLRIREKLLPPDDQQLINPLDGLAQVFEKKGDDVRAEQFFDRALKLREKQPAANDAAISRNAEKLANVYYRNGKLDRAGALYEYAFERLERAVDAKKFRADNPSRIALLRKLGRLSLEQGEYARAEAFFERACALLAAQHGENSPDAANALNDVAAAAAYKGDFKKAENYYLRSLMIHENIQPPDNSALATTLNNLGNLYSNLDRYSQALPLFSRALKLTEKTAGGEDIRTAQALTGLGSAYQGMGELKRAEPLYLRALTIYDRSKSAESLDAATTLNNLAILTLLNSGAAKAEPMYRRALMIRETTLGRRHPSVAKTLDSLAVLHDLQGETDRAIDLRNRSLEIREYQLGLTLMTGSEEQKRAYITHPFLTDEFNITLSLNARSAPRDPHAARMAMNLVLQRKGRVLDAMTDGVGALRRRLDPQDRALLDELSTVNSRLANLSLNDQGGAQIQDEIARLDHEKKRLESAISERSAEFSRQAQPVTLERIQRLIPSDAALVEIAAYRPFDPREKRIKERFGAARYSAYVLKSEGPPSFVKLGEARAIDRSVEALRRALRNRRRTDVKVLARRLDQLTMQQIRAALGETRRVLISPDGALNLIPFAALVDERNRYLATRYSFIYLTSGRDLLRFENRQHPGSDVIIVANPTFGESPGVNVARGFGLAAKEISPFKRPRIDFSQIYFPALPGAAEEAAALKSLFPRARLLVEEQADESTVKKVSSPKILHLATHGFFLDEVEPTDVQSRGFGLAPKGVRPISPKTGGGGDQDNFVNPLLRSGLALAGANQRQSGIDNGILTALEVADLNLQGTKLVVLSACDTGLGEIRSGEGVYGLRRALVLAGSESQLISLWRVSDFATRDLMIAFYERLQRGLGRNEALQQVQLQILKTRKRGHPYFWASFIQSGEWANLEEKR